jgi:hypothetical protein
MLGTASCGRGEALVPRVWHKLPIPALRVDHPAAPSYHWALTSSNLQPFKYPGLGAHSAPAHESRDLAKSQGERQYLAAGGGLPDGLRRVR